MMTLEYKQVSVRRNDAIDVWWIDAALAVRGKRVRRDDGSIWLGEKHRSELALLERDHERFAYVLGISDVNPRDRDDHEVYAI